MSKIYVDKTFRVSDDTSYHYELETVEDGLLVEFSYHEDIGKGLIEQKNSITFPSAFAPILGKLLLEQFTED